MTPSIEAVLPPLVAPGPALTTAQVERYSRHLILPGVGDLGQRRLGNARVAVIGAGGLGSPVLTYLAAAGVGTIGVVDFDVVEQSNLQRQTIHRSSDVGRLKAASAADAIVELNPLIRVVQHTVRLDAGNALDILGGYDLVVDGTDNFATRYLVNDACVLLGIPDVWGSVFQFGGQASVFWASHGPHYREIFPAPPPAGSVPSCGEGGVLGVTCATIGAVLATEAVKLICGIGRPLVGRLLVFDALAMTHRTVQVRKDPAAATVSMLVDYDAFCGTTEPALSPVGGLTSPQLNELINSGAEVALIDVREPAEFRLGALPGARSIPLADLSSPTALDLVRDHLAVGPVVVYCKAGARSARAVATLESAGLTGVLDLQGGIVGWSTDIDPSLPRY